MEKERHWMKAGSKIFRISSWMIFIGGMTGFAVLGYAYYFLNRDYSGGNHSFLFGTAQEAFLSGNRRMICWLLAFCPLPLAFVYRKKPVSILLFAISGTLLFLFSKMMIAVLTD
jgi:hypothetical protein